MAKRKAKAKKSKKRTSTTKRSAPVKRMSLKRADYDLQIKVGRDLITQLRRDVDGLVKTIVNLIDDMGGIKIHVGMDDAPKTAKADSAQASLPGMDKGPIRAVDAIYGDDEKPKDTAQKNVEEMTKDQLTTILQETIASKGLDAVAAIVQKHGATRITDLKSSEYASVASEARAL